MDQNDTQLEQGVTPESNQTPENNQPPESTQTPDNHNMESLLQQEGLGIDFPAQGEIRSGFIASISPGQILVSVGTKSEGVITGKELEAILPAELEAIQDWAGDSCLRGQSGRSGMATWYFLTCAPVRRSAG